MFDESLSALIDGELDPAEAQHLLDQIKRDPALREAWTRQHLLRAALRRQLPASGAHDIAARVAERLHAEVVTSKVVDLTARLRCAPDFGTATAAPVREKAEPAAPVPVPASGRMRRRVAMGFGLAASLTIAALLVPRMAESPSGAPAPSQIAGNQSQGWSDVNPETAQELNDYLLDHHSAAESNLASVPAYARLVTSGLQDAAYQR